MSVSRSRDDSAALGGIVNGYAPLDSGLLIPAAYTRATGCHVSGSSTALSSGAYVSLAFGDTDTYDSDGFHDPSTNNTRLTVPTGLGGIYLLHMYFTWPSSGSANTDRRLAYRVNAGADNIADRETYSVTSSTLYRTSVSVLPLAAGDYVECRQWTGIASTTTTVYGASLFLIGKQA